MGGVLGGLAAVAGRCRLVVEIVEQGEPARIAAQLEDLVVEQVVVVDSVVGVLVLVVDDVVVVPLVAVHLKEEKSIYFTILSKKLYREHGFNCIIEENYDRWGIIETDTMMKSN